MNRCRIGLMPCPNTYIVPLSRGLEFKICSNKTQTKRTQYKKLFQVVWGSKTYFVISPNYPIFTFQPRHPFSIEIHFRIKFYILEYSLA